MSRPIFWDFDVPAENANGAALRVADFRDKTIHVSGTFDCTVTLQGTLDGSTWVAITDGAFTDAGGEVLVPGTYQQLRFVTSDYSSGAAVAKLAAFDERSA